MQLIDRFYQAKTAFEIVTNELNALTKEYEQYVELINHDKNSPELLNLLNEVQGEIFRYQRIQEELKKLGENPNPDDVKKIKSSLINIPECDDCNENYESVIKFESSEGFNYICSNCLSKALKLCNS